MAGLLSLFGDILSTLSFDNVQVDLLSSLISSLIGSDESVEQEVSVDVGLDVAELGDEEEEDDVEVIDGNSEVLLVVLASVLLNRNTQKYFYPSLVKYFLN